MASRLGRELSIDETLSAACVHPDSALSELFDKARASPIDHRTVEDLFVGLKHIRDDGCFSGLEAPNLARLLYTEWGALDRGEPTRLAAFLGNPSSLEEAGNSVSVRSGLSAIPTCRLLDAILALIEALSSRKKQITRLGESLLASPTDFSAPTVDRIRSPLDSVLREADTSADTRLYLVATVFYVPLVRKTNDLLSGILCDPRFPPARPRRLPTPTGHRHPVRRRPRKVSRAPIETHPRSHDLCGLKVIL